MRNATCLICGERYSYEKGVGSSLGCEKCLVQQIIDSRTHQLNTAHQFSESNGTTMYVLYVVVDSCCRKCDHLKNYIEPLTDTLISDKIPSNCLKPVCEISFQCMSERKFLRDYKK